LFILVAGAASAQTMSVEVNGKVSFNSISTGTFSGAQVGDPVKMTFQVATPGISFDPGHYSIYLIDAATFALDVNGETDTLNPQFETYYEVMNDYPVSDGTFIFLGHMMTSGVLGYEIHQSDGTMFDTDDIIQLAGTYPSDPTWEDTPWYIAGSYGEIWFSIDDFKIAEDTSATFTVIAEGWATTVVDITPDGSWAAGIDYGRAFRYSSGTGVEYLTPEEWQWTHTVGISDDGTQLASSVEYGDRVFGPARWTEGLGWEFLDTLYPDPPYQGGNDWSYGSGYDISGDGSVVCGLAWHPNYRASGFSWTADGGIVDLGRPDEEHNARATAISSDGATIVGFWEHLTWGHWRPVRWVNNGPADLFLGEETWGEAYGASSDGSLIVGQVGFLDDPGYGYALAYLYSESEGYTNIGLLPWQDPVFCQSMATDVSDNGIVVGWSGETGPWGVLEPFVWTREDGIMLAADYLAAHGVVVPSNYQIATVVAISADGTTLGGQAINLDTYYTAAWVATIAPATPTCHDGTVNLGASPSPSSVLSVNGSFGGSQHVVTVGVGESFHVEMESAPGGPVPAPFALYAWLGEPDETTESLQPKNLGTMCFATPWTGGTPALKRVWNNIGHEGKLGTPSYPSTPAPSMVFEKASGTTNPMSVTFQGFLMDNASASSQLASVTNAVILRIQ